MDCREYVYFATDGIDLKVGRTWSIVSRMKRLSRDRNRTVTPIGFFTVDNYWKACDLEVKIHRHLRKMLNTSRGEWYKTCDDIFNYVKKLEGYTEWN